jgi:hypothetical protein
MPRGKKAGTAEAPLAPDKADGNDKKAAQLDAAQQEIEAREEANRLAQKEQAIKDRQEKLEADEKRIQEAEARAERDRRDRESRKREEEDRRRQTEEAQQKREEEERAGLLELIETVSPSDRSNLKWAIFKVDEQSKEERFIEYAPHASNLFETAKRIDQEDGGLGGDYIAKLWNGSRWCTRQALSRMVSSDANLDLVDKVPLQTSILIYGEGSGGMGAVPASRFRGSPQARRAGLPPFLQPNGPTGLSPYGQNLINSMKGPGHPDMQAQAQREKEAREERLRNEAKLDKEREQRMTAEIAAIKASSENNSGEMLKLLAESGKGNDQTPILTHMMQSSQNTMNMMFKMMEDNRARDESRRADESARLERERKDAENLRREELRERERREAEQREARREERERLEAARREDLERERMHNERMTNLMRDQNKAPEEQMRMIGNMSTMVSGVMSSSMQAQVTAMKTAQDAIKSMRTEDESGSKSEFQKLLETILPHSKDIILGAAEQAKSGVPVQQVTDQATAALEAKIQQAQSEQAMEGAAVHSNPAPDVGEEGADAPQPDGGSPVAAPSGGLAGNREQIMPVILGAIEEDDPTTLAEMFLNPATGVPPHIVTMLPIAPLALVRGKLNEIDTEEEKAIINNPDTDDFFKRFKTALRTEKARVRAIQDAYLNMEEEEEDETEEETAPVAEDTAP